MNGYRIRYSARAVKALESLPEKIAAACVEFIAGPLAAEPQRVGKPLGRELSGRFSARRGTYRVVYTIDTEARVVGIVHIQRRRHVYRSP